MRPPPGKTPGMKHCANGETDSRTALVETVCEIFTGVMLPLEPDDHTSRAITARTVPFPLLSP
jgi:hypothetical protein